MSSLLHFGVTFRAGPGSLLAESSGRDRELLRGERVDLGIRLWVARVRGAGGCNACVVCRLGDWRWCATSDPRG